MKFLRFKHDRLARIGTALGEDCAIADAGAWRGFAEMRRRHGGIRAVTRCLSALLRPAGNPDFPLAAGNVQRKLIRLPWLAKVPLFMPVYKSGKSLGATLSGAAIDAALADHPDHVVLIWNGSMHPDTVAADRCARLGRPALFLENGFFPGTLQADPKGVNALSSLPRDKDFYLNWSPTEGASLPQHLGQRASKVAHDDSGPLPHHYLFAPFQVPSDMQITRLSPWVPDMEAFHAALCAAADANPDAHFVIKEHPSFRRSIKSNVLQHPRVSFHNGMPTPDLISRARAVVTINSTVGMEALVLDKPVIVLGEAIFGVDELTLVCRDQAALNAATARVTTWVPDPVLRDRFLRYINAEFLIPATLDAPDPEINAHLTRRATRCSSSPAKTTSSAV